MLALLFNFSLFAKPLSPLLIPLLVLGVSFSGSWHCAAMCGGFVTLTTSNRSSMITYQIGRLLSYEILGVLFGFFGKYALSNTVNGLFSLIIAFALGLGFIKIGLSNLRQRSSTSFSYFSKLSSKLMTKFFSKKEKQLSNNFLIGFFSVFLPCGWLYSFILAAVITESPYYSAILLFFFWLGSIPALSIAPIFFRKLLYPISKKFPKISAILFIGIGILTIAVKIYPLFYPQENQTAILCSIFH